MPNLTQVNDGRIRITLFDVKITRLARSVILRIGSENIRKLQRFEGEDIANILDAGVSVTSEERFEECTDAT